MKYYVYVSEYGQRVYANIFEADSKNDIKKLLLDELDWLDEVKLRRGKNGLNQYITSIHEIDDYWEGVFLKPIVCINCSNEFRKIDKLKYNAGGSSMFCSAECQDENRNSIRPNEVTSWNNGTVYKITHKPTGKFYVGVTTRWLMQRWWEHIKAESGSPFHQAMKEHDLTEFTFEVLEYFKPSELDPYEREAYWINKLDAINRGFNTAGAHKAKEIEVKNA